MSVVLENYKMSFKKQEKSMFATSGPSKLQCRNELGYFLAQNCSKIRKISFGTLMEGFKPVVMKKYEF